MKVKNVTIGADPELFIKDKVSGKFVSAIGIIPGEKKKAVQMEGLPAGYKSQIDNVLGEYNIPPVTNKKDFIESFLKANEWFSNFLGDRNMTIENRASAIYDEDQLTDPKAKEIGCDPSFNCWTEQLTETPEKFEGRLRTAGTHIHIGYEGKNIDTNFDLMQACDVFLGLPSILIDTDAERRKYYGQPGDFRHTDYGCEYRVLSGLFTKNEEYTGWVWDQVMRAIDFVNNNEPFNPEVGINVMTIVKKNDIEMAKKICASLNIIIPESILAV